MLIFWLHLVSLAVYLGSLVGLWFMILPGLSLVPNHQEQVKLLARSLRLYSPLQTGSLGVLILSGAVRLTDLKAAYRELFLRELGMTLAVKLLLAFILVVLSTYQSMAVAHRFVRESERDEPVTPERLRSVTQRLKASTIAILVLALATIWVALHIREP